ncbi:hypothetical protein CDL15_Pgr009404 [Punica granatum]|uniref:Aminotransferase-like plant mobile domain-containing protein n=1 Tax=Punica granatum TaxID=22663 RepID=A0A218Y2J0_PUNGR|nr:hypothetical protein CDL15_Pgr009404 [Punica granatum]
MDRSHPCLRLDDIIMPSADITRLWNTFRPVDRAFLRPIIGDLPLLADSPIDWTLLEAAISYWDIQRAVFSFQGSELAPTVEEYANLGDYNWRHTATRLVNVSGWRKETTSIFPKKSTLRSRPSLNHRRHTFAPSYSRRRTPGILRRPSDTSPAPGTFRGASPTGLTNIRRHQ